MTGITAAIAYGFSALAQIKWLVFSILFIWYSRNTGHETWVEVWGPFLLAGAALILGIPVYLSMRAKLTRPSPVPPYSITQRS
ncbi:hypothetical protein ODJ79_45150 [Actinoplanes sp. KI2]|uniref:hypothetical protein n=1 Tax=Actinoplanes sp. KI2 TaxID=2983315 RepID=UPI0021D5B95D|nr:hypothetical protein [Actinoplanes sp. KI2]MCU7730947.1 hypothetical protein [Actinoplanes sp. KI2]